MKASDYIVIFSTAANRDEAEKIAKTLVEEKWAACVNVLPSMRSFYRWEGRIHEDEEFLLLIKTKKTLFEGVSERIRSLHGYEVPEVVALSMEEGSEEYLAWLSASVR